MTDLTGAPAAAESAPAPEAISTPAIDDNEGVSLSEAFEAYSKRNSSPAESAEPATAEPELVDETNAAPPEEAPSEVTEEPDPAAEPPIERPRSWTKDVDDVWQTLPRPLQEKVAAREQEREREIRRSQNETAEKLKGLTAKEQAAEQAKQQYEAQLPALMQTLQDAQQSAFADVRTVDDVTKLANEDPFRYLQWQAHQTKLQAVNAENERVRGEKSRAEQTDWANHVQKENELVAEYIPELADKTKAAALTSRAADRLSELGFKPDELADLANGKQKLSIYDHRIQRLIFSDLKLSDIQKAKAVAVAKPVPQVQRPGVAQPKGNGDAIQALNSKATSTGDVEDVWAAYQARKKASR